MKRIYKIDKNIATKISALSPDYSGLDIMSFMKAISPHDLCFHNDRMLVIANISPKTPLDFFDSKMSGVVNGAFLETIGNIEHQDMRDFDIFLKGISKEENLEFFYTYSKEGSSLLEEIGFIASEDILYLKIENLPKMVTSDNITIKIPDMSELKELDEILKDELYLWYKRPWFEFRMNPDGFLIAKEGDMVCGFANVRKFQGKESPWGYATYTFVSEDFRKRGIGRMLDTHVLSKAFNDGIKTVYTHAPKFVMGYQKKIGWEEVRKDKTLFLKL